MEQFLLFTQACGLPLQDVNYLNCTIPDMEYVVDNANFRVIQFTGSNKVAEHLAAKTHGRVRLEDAGFDWKILGPDVQNLDYVAWVSDQDAYAASGQKCSAQSIVFVHENWVKAGFVDKIAHLAARRKLEDLTIGPVLTWDNNRIKAHIDKILAIPGAVTRFGGKPLTNHSIPDVYGAYEPTAVEVPLDQFVKNFKACSEELFGPFQLIVPYGDKDVDTVIQCCNDFSNHLTAGVVSNDVLFLDKVLGQTVNGVTYAGNRARTTGAPQNHWFGPCGDPRGAGIGTKEAILTVWTTHREIIRDYGPITTNWKTPQAS
jgi:1-pyrroline-5-carboxylate dehydrogenase